MSEFHSGGHFQPLNAALRVARLKLVQSGRTPIQQDGPEGDSKSPQAPKALKLRYNFRISGAQERTPKPFLINALLYKDSNDIVNSNENAAADGPRNGVESANETTQHHDTTTKTGEFVASENLGKRSWTDQAPLAFSGLVFVVRDAPESVQGTML